MSPQMHKTVSFFEQLSPITVSSVDEIYSHDVFFKDPFNEIKGIEKMREVYEKLFEQVPNAKFHVMEVVEDGRTAFMNWEMTFKAFGKDQVVHGASHLKFIDGPKLSYHRDYWDSSEEVFEKIPFLGAVFNLTRKVF